jgi:single-stranded-DNA-specific exonuclease
MNLKWNPIRAAEVSQALLNATSDQPLVAQVLAGRGIDDPEEVRRFLDPDAYTPADPETLHDMVRGVERIEQAIRNNEHILVWGDFDVDGQTSTSLLVSMLERLGGKVSYHIPVREHESHGVAPQVLQRYIENGFDLLVTCDTGIAAVDSVAFAHEAGIDVIITDHHDLPDELPKAFALINPKFHAEDNPLSGLPGVGVAYKVIEALFTRAGRAAELESCLDLVAVGIVADLALQRQDTRYLLQRGLEVLRSTERPGFLALADNAGVKVDLLNDEDIGFQIGPRLNAVGRLSDANVSVPLLTTTDEAQAKEIADQLERLNEERKFETAVVYDSAAAQVQQEPSLRQYAALVLANPLWHEGVIGIVASRMVDEFGKPTIMLTTPEGKPARGSARSVEGYHITRAIATQSDILMGFGGHPMAAGLSLDAENIEAFRRGVSKALVDQRTGRAPEPTLDIELELPLEELTLETALQLEALAPFGPGNPPVNILCPGLQVEEDRPIGKDKAHRKLVVSDMAGHKCEVLWWSSADEALPNGRLDLVVRVRPGFFRGKQTLSVTLQDFERSGRAESEGSAGPKAVVFDCRAESAPLEKLDEILAAAEDLQIWGEAAAHERAKPRAELMTGKTLVVWSAPPGRGEVASVLERVQPEEIYVFAKDPGVDSYEAFTQRLGGLVKYVLAEYEGGSSLEKLAGATAHSERTVVAGLEVLPAMGVQATRDEEGEILFERCQVADVAAAADRLRLLLDETRAFRKAFRTTEDVGSFFAVAAGTAQQTDSETY